MEKPALDYMELRKNESGEYHFSGEFESITGGDTLWVRNDELTIPVSLNGASTYIFPLKDNAANSVKNVNASVLFDYSGLLQRVRWNKILSFTAETKVFVAGRLKKIDDRQIFCFEKNNPLLVILYECSEETLALGVVCSGRAKADYMNPITPYAIAAGIFSLFYIAQNFYSRPAYHTTVLSSIIAMFSPLFPLIPPGILFTMAYKHFWLSSGLVKVHRDISAQPERNLTIKALLLEAAAWVFLFAGIALNIVFTVMIFIVLA
ncbi:hypothetical protein AGMMS50212_04260 [Spirochaetia bacterium]|nr:hypothetical protein AGMMS50212_04260 [Spirochaetia bacterium]